MLRTLIFAFIAFNVAIFISAVQSILDQYSTATVEVVEYDEAVESIKVTGKLGEDDFILHVNFNNETSDDFDMPATLAPTAESTHSLFPTPTPSTLRPTALATDESQHFSPYRLRLRVIDGALNIRSAPSIDSSKSGQLPVGSVFLTDPDSELMADDFIWHRHALGWSAIASAQGTPHAEISDGLDFQATPHYGSVFTVAPVDLEQIEWLQYFGDTVFARAYGHLHNYDGYAQGLHGGLDFGIDSREAHIPRAVFAGTVGLIEKTFPNAVWVKHGDYVIKYQHLESIPDYQRGDLVMPDTFLGNISRTDNEQENVHLHLEVVYDDQYLVNPAQLMLTPIPWHFYESTGYAADAEFQNPSHQPVIELTQ